MLGESNENYIVVFVDLANKCLLSDSGKLVVHMKTNGMWNYGDENGDGDNNHHHYHQTTLSFK